MTCNQCANPAIAKGLCPKHYSQMRMATGTRLRYDFTCLTCDKPGDSFNPKAQRHAYCQRVSASQFQAQYLAKCREHSQEVELYNPPVLSAPVMVIPGSVIVFTNCKTCGTQFLSRYTYQYCSDTCLRKANREGKRNMQQVRRARLRNAFIAPVNRKQIFERDNFDCQLCGQAMEMEASSPQHKYQECCDSWCYLAPTIDHILALANGGSHEPNNVQAAHFICNATKSNFLAA